MTKLVSEASATGTVARHPISISRSNRVRIAVVVTASNSGVFDAVSAAPRITFSGSGCNCTVSVR